MRYTWDRYIWYIYMIYIYIIICSHFGSAILVQPLFIWLALGQCVCIQMADSTLRRSVEKASIPLSSGQSISMGHQARTSPSKAEGETRIYVTSKKGGVEIQVLHLPDGRKCTTCTRTDDMWILSCCVCMGSRNIAGGVNLPMIKGRVPSGIVATARSSSCRSSGLPWTTLPLQNTKLCWVKMVVHVWRCI